MATALEWINFINIVLKVLGGVAAGISVIIMMYKPKTVAQPPNLIVRPAGLPLLGNALDLIPDKIVENVHKHVVKHSAGGKKIVELTAFFTRMYIVTDLQLVKEMSLKRPKVFRRAVQMDYSGQALGFSNGLFHCHGNRWNRVRKLTSPPLAKYHVTQNMQEMCVEAKRLVKRLDKMADGKTVVDVKQELFNFTLHVIIQNAFGLELQGDTAEYFFEGQFCRDLLVVFRFFIESIMWPAPFWLFKAIPHFANIEKEGRAAADRFTQLFLEIIAQKRRELAEHPEASDKHSVIDIMLSKEGQESAGGEAVTDDEILANVKTFFAAGSETSSVVLSWTLYFLAQDKALLAEAQAEVAPFYALDSSNMTNDELWLAHSVEKMPLCHAIFKEALRMCDPASHNFFQLEDGLTEYRLSNGMVIFPQDVVVAAFDSIHWNEENFEQPLQFKPKRWWTTDAEKLAKMESAFFGFGMGTRQCPAQTLAMVEGVIGLSSIIHHFNFDLACPVSEIKRVMTFTAQPTKMPMTFSKRR